MYNFFKVAAKLIAIGFIIAIGLGLLAEGLVKPFYKGPLYSAVFSKDPHKLERLIQSGTNLNKKDYLNKTLLHHAIEKADVSIVDRLILADAHVNTKTNDNWDSLLHYAVKRENLSIVDSLIQAGANVNDFNFYCKTPLCYAVERENIPIAERLIEAGASHPLALYSIVKKGDFLILELVERRLRANNPSFLYTILSFCLHVLSNTNGDQYYVHITLKLLSWYIYQTCTDNLKLSLEWRNQILQLLNSSYQSSPMLRQINPLLSWFFTKMLDCTSKIELIESLLEYLSTADEGQQNALIEYLDYLFLQKEILDEFNANFNTLTAKFSLDLLEKLKSLARYRHAQNLTNKIFDALDEKTLHHLIKLTSKAQFSLDLLEKLKSLFRYRQAESSHNKIFHSLDENTLNQLLKLNTRKNSTEYIHILDKIEDNLITYCHHTSIKSPFVEKIISRHQSSQNQKIIKLVQEGHGLTDQEISNIFRMYIEDILNILKDARSHLDYIIKTEGVCLKSSTSFGMESGLDILLTIDQNHQHKKM